VLEIEYSFRANNDLTEIWLYGEANWGSNRADEYLLQLTDRVDWLAENQQLVSKRDIVREGILSFVDGAHAIYFIANSDTLTIIRILHQRMDPKKHL